MALLIKAGQMTASDYVPTCPNLLLASEGASTDAMLDFMLEDDLAEALQRVSMAENLAAMGLPLVPTFIRYNPFPRPWHVEWLALVN